MVVGRVGRLEVGRDVGVVQRVFVDRDTNEPTWITVPAGRLARQEAVVPLAGSRLGPDGLWLGVSKDAISNGPVIDIGSELDIDVVTKLNGYYGRSVTGTQPATGPDEGFETEPAPSRVDIYP